MKKTGTLGRAAGLERSIMKYTAPGAAPQENRRPTRKVAETALQLALQVNGIPRGVQA